MAIYRMFSGTVKAGENAIEKIRKSLEEAGEKRSALKLDWIGFEAEPGTEIYLNNHKDAIKVPSCGNFITPYNGQNYMSLTSLVFKNGFTGDIYYIY